MKPMMNQNNILINNQMNMQQQMQQLMQKMKEQEELNKSIYIIFDNKSLENDIQRSVQCKLDEKLGDVFERYRQMINGPNLNDLRFIYNSHTLHPDSLVKEVGLVEHSRIHVRLKNAIIGG